MNELFCSESWTLRERVDLNRYICCLAGAQRGFPKIRGEFFSPQLYTYFRKEVKEGVLSENVFTTSGFTNDLPFIIYTPSGAAVGFLSTDLFQKIYLQRTFLSKNLVVLFP